jgi:hypothetical protein
VLEKHHGRKQSPKNNENSNGEDNRAARRRVLLPFPLDCDLFVEHFQQLLWRWLIGLVSSVFISTCV